MRTLLGKRIRRTSKRPDPGQRWSWARKTRLVLERLEERTTPSFTVSGFTATPPNPLEGQAFTLDVAGTGFTNTLGVELTDQANNHFPLAASFVSATELTASVPAATSLEEGSYTVTVTDPADANNNVNAPGHLTIADAPLTATATNFNATAGTALTQQTVATFADANPNATAADFPASNVTIDWGDGTTSAGTVTLSGSTFTVAGSHTYSQAGSLSVTTDIKDVGGSTATPVGKATVAPAVLTVTGQNVTATAGTPFTGVVATFTDSNPNATANDFTTSIDWGDGHTSAGTVSLSNGTFSVTGTNTYAQTGTFTITTSITGTVDASQGMGTSKATVQPAFVSQTISAVEGQSFTGTVATLTGVATNVKASDLKAAIDWGDGTTSAGTVTGSKGTFTVAGTHTFAEEGNYTVKVSTSDSANLSATGTDAASVADAPLFAGNPFTAGNPVAVSGDPTTVLGQFETMLGGKDNGNTLGSQATGFRTINWDGVKLDGTDPGSVVITQGKTIGMAEDRFQTRGTQFEQVYAVSGDGFVDVNPTVQGQFTPFSSPNIFAMFNDNTIDFSFVIPSANGTAPVAAATRAFGAVFLNVTQAKTTSMEFFNGDQSLGTFVVPVGGANKPEFLGEIFSNPIITRVHITLGDGVLFYFDGTTARPGDDAKTHNLVATDDFVYAEPQAAGATGSNFIAALTGVQGTPITNGVIATFHDQDPNGNVKDYTAGIDWGDGTTSAGSIATNQQGGFNVVGSHLYLQPGTFRIHVNVQDFGGSSVGLDTQIQVNVPPFAAGPDTIAVVPSGTGSSATQTEFVIRPNGTLAFRTAGSGTDSAWTTASLNLPAGVTARSVSAVNTANGVVAYVQTSNLGLVRYVVATDTATTIGGAGSIAYVSAGTDLNGADVGWVVTTKQGLLEFSSAKGWQNPIGGDGSIADISAITQNAVVAVTTDHGLFEHDESFGWHPLSSANFAVSVRALIEPATNQLVVLASQLNGKLTLLRVGVGGADLEPAGTVQQTNAQGTPNPEAISLGLDASNRAVAFALTNDNRLLEDTLPVNGTTIGTPTRTVLVPPTGNNPLTGTPIRISADSADRVFMILSDGSVWGHDPSTGFFEQANPGFAAVPATT